MLKTIDRIGMATPDADSTAKGWISLLGAEKIGEDTNLPGTKRVTYAVGTSLVEFLEPDGTGPIDDALRARGGAHLYRAGVSTEDLAGLKAQLQSQDIAFEEFGDELILDFVNAEGGHFSISATQATDRPRVGLLDYLYEVTILDHVADDSTKRVAETFGLDASVFCPISSSTFKYDGSLTLFRKKHLHRFEVITPNDETTTMGRFLKRAGPSYYMCFAETPDMLAIEQRAKEQGAGITIDRPEGRPDSLPADQMWLHPPALGGVMLGLSRPTQAWSWSGHPEWIKPIDDENTAKGPTFT